MKSIPFKNQFDTFLQSSNEYRYQNEFLKGTDGISRFVLDKEYNAFLTKCLPSIPTNPAIRKELEHSNSLHDIFNDTKVFEKIWKHYPELASLVQKKVDANKTFVHTILKHLEEDQAFLKERLGISNITIKNVHIGMGDVHQMGQSTAIVTFTDGHKVVYKPRSAALDIAYYSIIKSFNDFDSSLTLKTIKFIDREEHSWCEFIEHAPCNTPADIEAYYEKTGVLLTLMYLLKGVDIHFENIIAHGFDPVIIDLECLFHRSNIDYFNILNTGMCPILTLNGFDNKAVDLSGMGASGDIKMNKKEWKWSHIGTDALNLEHVYGYIRAHSNQPVLNDKPISPANYMDQIMSGFNKACRWVWSFQETIRTNRSHPFKALQNKTFRIIPRRTQHYTDILNNSYTPKALLGTEVRRKSIQSDLQSFELNFPLLDQEGKETIMQYEWYALERQDIPYFTGNSSTFEVKESGTPVLENYYTRTPYEALIDHILRFDKKAAQNQKHLIESSFASCHPAQSNISKKQPITKVRSMDFTNTDYKTEIESIADHIVDSAMIRDGEVSWNSFNEESGVLVFNVLNDSLYSGKLGVALFLSNASKFLNTQKYNQVIDLILTAATTNYLSGEQEPSLAYSSGISGLIHALMEIDPLHYTSTAIDFAHLITSEAIQNDDTYDFMGGAAGCLITLSNLYKASTSETILSKCLELGDHLLRQRQQDSASNHLCWASKSGVGLTGYSHGASGIGLALLKLYEISGEKRFQEAFYEALSYENHHYVDSEKNWRDLRNDQGKFQNSWCHGAAGIGLARIQAYEILKDGTLLRDINRAISGTQNTDVANLDHYCCGNAGRVSFLMEAAALTSDKELEGCVQQYIDDLLLKRRRNGYSETYSNSDVSTENISLYRGISGIGQMLIRYSELFHKSDPVSNTTVKESLNLAEVG